MKRVLILVLTLLTTNVFAGTTANEVETMCMNPFTEQACYAYFAGFAQGVTSTQAMTVTSSTITDLTVRRMFVKHMRNMPEDGDELASTIIINDLLAAGKAKLNTQPTQRNRPIH